MTFDDLRKANVQRCEELFHPLVDWTPTEWALAVAGEAGEMCNAVKKLLRVERGQQGNDNPPNIEAAHEQIGEEIADCIIYLDLLAARLGMDLNYVVSRKFNRTSRKFNSRVLLASMTTDGEGNWS